MPVSLSIHTYIRPQDSIQGQGHGGTLNVRNWPISKVSPPQHVIKKTDTPRQYMNFNWTDCWCSSSFWFHM